MNKQSLNECWTVRRLDGDGEPVAVDLPYDAMLREPRNASSLGGHNIGWFEGHDYEYRRELELGVDQIERRMMLQFEGVYHKAQVYVNDVEVASQPNGYLDIIADISDVVHAGTNVIRVVAHAADQPNSRWYTGAGIYRPVWLLSGGERCVMPDGVRIRTIAADRGLVGLRVIGSRPGTGTYVVLDADGHAVVSGDVPVGSDSDISGEVAVAIPDVRLWDEQTPYLYVMRVSYGDDVTETRFGVRSIAWSADSGFTVNGRRVILKGACVHSDNQLLGAESYRESEERRVRLLKNCGYNAIRSAHNAASRQLIEACDRLGMYLVDEYADCWYIHKTCHDYASYVESRFERDLASIVTKDYSHPSVVMYSIGNEVAETAQKRGVGLTRDMTACLHRLDGTRPVTCGVNIFFNLLSSLGFGVYSDAKAEREAENTGKTKAVGSEFYNNLAGLLGDTVMKFGATLPGCNAKTKDAFAAMDISGYNYGIMRYRRDLRRHPDRLIVGSETFCRDAAAFMRIAKTNTRLIGDFVWAGIDYIGETGIGSWEYEDYAPKDGPEHGWLTAGAGRLDITGSPLGEAYYTRVALEHDPGPYLAVRPVYQTGSHSSSAWKMTDALRSWSFHGCDGLPASVEVYSNAARVRLELNGTVVGTKSVRDCVARFSMRYHDGTLIAVALDGQGREIGRDELVTAQESTRLEIFPETGEPGCEQSATVPTRGLLHLRLRYTDEYGVWKPMEKHEIQVSVTGGMLKAAGNGAPYNPDGYLNSTVRTYYGQALVIVRADCGGTLVVTAEDGSDTATYIAEIAGEG